MNTLDFAYGRRLAAAVIGLSAMAGACGGGEPDTGAQSGSATLDGGSNLPPFTPALDSGSIPTGPTGTGGLTGGPGLPGGPVADAGGPVSGGLPCAVKQIVDSHCGTCHGASPAFSAPMALTTPAQFQAAGVSDKTKKVYQLVNTRINATTPAVKMPPTTSTQLSASDLSALNAWLAQGAPGSNEACSAPADGGVAPGGDDGPIDKTGLDCYKFLAHAQGNKTAKFAVGNATDAYYAFGFQAPWQGTVYGEVFTPVIDNTHAIHHWLLYEEPTTDGSIQTTIGQHASGKLLAGWAPGGQTYNFRKYGDVGYELPASTYTLEIHYNSSDPSAADASGVEVCVQKAKPQNVAGMSWVGYDNLVLPSTEWTGTCDPGHTQPIHILFVTPHLHQTGRHLKSVINGPSGSRTLLDEPFDFAYQRTYEKTEMLMPGESITTTCTFSEPQTFGQATTAEMCYLFTYSYPKGLLSDNGIWGTIAHGEGACLGE